MSLSFVVNEGTRIGFLHSYYTLDNPENDDAFLSHIAHLLLKGQSCFVAQVKPAAISQLTFPTSIGNALCIVFLPVYSICVNENDCVRASAQAACFTDPRTPC